MGLPGHASDIPALRERCGDAALYCDPNDLASMITAIESMMDNVELRNEYRARGYRRAGAISWDRCARETLDTMMPGCTGRAQEWVSDADHAAIRCLCGGLFVQFNVLVGGQTEGAATAVATAIARRILFASSAVFSS